MADDIRNRIIDVVDSLSDEELHVFYKVMVNIAGSDNLTYIEPLTLAEYERHERIISEMQRGEYTLLGA